MGNPAVQVDMIDNNCSDSPHSIRYTMFVTTASREALKVGDPTLTGEPIVGETLTCVSQRSLALWGSHHQLLLAGRSQQERALHGSNAGCRRW